MPNFLLRRWYGYHMIGVLCFTLVLIAGLAVYHQYLAIVAFSGFLLFAAYLYRAERAFRLELQEYILTLSHRVKGATQTTIDEIPVGILLYDRHDRIVWHNPYIKEMMDQDSLVGVKVEDVFPLLLSKKQQANEWRISVGDATYLVSQWEDERLFFFQNVTQLAMLEQQYEDERVVFGFLHMDNYEDAGQGMDDQNRALLLTKVTNTISNWAQQHDIVLRRFDSDKFFLTMSRATLTDLVQEQFELLDEIREMTHRNKIPITLSLGVSSHGTKMIPQMQTAQSALDIALARGGDQAAVHNGEHITFFGGKTNAVERRTRVRARVISHALTNLIRDSERVLIMGHAEPDMDALGASIGVLKAVQSCQREGHIVLAESNPSIERLLQSVYHHETLSDAILSPDRALQMLDRGTLVILVDTHKPSFAIEPRLIERANKVVVIDHHRRGEEFVTDPVLVYLEPYASSTCELITELLQYQGDRMEMDTLEATSLLAGIVVDTKSFSFRAGSRTFEAASFLRSHGADLTMVQSLLKEDMDQFVKRAEIVKNTEVIYDKVAVAMGEEGVRYDQLLIAQTADTLLNMNGIGASFVIGLREDEKVAISARSQGDLNVQMVMERMGGGGHLTHAAVQLENKTVREVRELLLKQLKKFLMEGEDT
ncbi:DHH family phosphoesterase [Mechercharimyces sp. CAU 1602]|uniref:DHH family phosphoesterase n=1 Tax=Mechercharimyces sp. CAU 1602 TaxID=2973933 RepID=UPI002161D82E|nr:DHH family phosphoesterase [Mechercharimyces sp. CAU 1602]MCS1352669.1 DHH family phosphoesterase [Mechercharimyces sp. CAU 1602]